jgi:hypothetical protein
MLPKYFLKNVNSLYLFYFLLEDFDCFNDGVLPGVVLLSLWRWSVLPVEVAILFGPGFSAILLLFCIY